MPPCEPWTTAEDVADCCGVTIGSDNTEALEAAAENASAILYILSGARFAGTCERTVRPVGRHICWGPWIIHRHERRRRLSRVKLAGYATAITEVLIDGQVVEPSLYRLDEHIYLTRMADPDGTPRAWPSGQRDDLPASEPNTFQVTYEYGLQPPGAGTAAARSLACELYKACPASGDSPGECKLPAGVTRIVRQGVTIDKVASIASMLRKGATGLTLVDAFLGGYGRPTRRSALWSPDIQPFARPEGITSGS